MRHTLICCYDLLLLAYFQTVIATATCGQGLRVKESPLDGEVHKIFAKTRLMNRDLSLDKISSQELEGCYSVLNFLQQETEYKQETSRSVLKKTWTKIDQQSICTEIILVSPHCLPSYCTCHLFESKLSLISTRYSSTAVRVERIFSGAP